jgi:hypothetical protein
MSNRPQEGEDQAAGAAPPEAADSEPNGEDEAGDFVARQVLEKDTVFFEG